MRRDLLKGLRRHAWKLMPLALAACGGGSEDAVQAELSAAATRRTALAAPVGTDAPATTQKLLDFAEQSFPQYFPGPQTNRNLNGWTYRYYPSTGTYIAVIDWRVFILGGPFGPEALDMGEVTQYVAPVAVQNPPPVVALTAPSAGSAIAPATVAIAATASDPGGSIAKVEFYAGAVKIGEDLTLPYAFSWTQVPVGSYSLTAVAVDNLGARTTSPAVDITVTANKAPTVSMTAPFNGGTFTAGATIALVAGTADDVGIAKVEFYAGTTKLGEDSTAPYSISWSAVAAGIYELTARATDTAGLTTVSPPVTVTVQPTAPEGAWTAAKLAKCPSVSGSNAPNHYLCTAGYLTGTQLFDVSKTCTVSISANGTTTLSSNGETYTVPPGGSVYFTKSSYFYLSLDTAIGSYPSIDIDIESVTESGKSFFVDGGKLQVDARSFDPRPTPTVTKALSCIFNVPKT